MEKQSLTDQYVMLFDRLPPLLETMDYEDDFYQDLMLKAIMNDSPITEEDIEYALKEKDVVYDTSDQLHIGKEKYYAEEAK